MSMQRKIKRSNKSKVRPFDQGIRAKHTKKHKPMAGYSKETK